MRSFKIAVNSNQIRNGASSVRIMTSATVGLLSAVRAEGTRLRLLNLHPVTKELHWRVPALACGTVIRSSETKR